MIADRNVKPGMLGVLEVGIWTAGSHKVSGSELLVERQAGTALKKWAADMAWKQR